MNGGTGLPVRQRISMGSMTEAGVVSRETDRPGLKTRPIVPTNPCRRAGRGEASRSKPDTGSRRAPRPGGQDLPAVDRIPTASVSVFPRCFTWNTGYRGATVMIPELGGPWKSAWPGSSRPTPPTGAGRDGQPSFRGTGTMCAGTRSTLSNLMQSRDPGQVFWNAFDQCPSLSPAPPLVLSLWPVRLGNAAVFLARDQDGAAFESVDRARTVNLLLDALFTVPGASGVVRVVDVFADGQVRHVINADSQRA